MVVLAPRARRAESCHATPVASTRDPSADSLQAGGLESRGTREIIFSRRPSDTLRATHPGGHADTRADVDDATSEPIERPGLVAGAHVTRAPAQDGDQYAACMYRDAIQTNQGTRTCGSITT
jgi:hypothetical protein